MAMLEDWNDQKDKAKKEESADLSTLNRAWYEIPPRNVNYFHEFNFKLVDAMSDGMIFLAMIVLIPFGGSIIAYAAFPEVKKETLQLVSMAISLITAIIGFAITFTRSREKFWAHGLGFAYLFVILPDLIIVVGSIILASVAKDKSQDTLDVYNSFISTVCQIIAEVIVIVWFFSRSTDGLASIKMTFRQNWKMLLIVVLIGLAALYVFSQVIFNMAYNKVFNITDDSTNQNMLTKVLDNDNKGVVISYVILLFISSVLVAPLCEEIATRSSFFANTGNKWIALVGSTIYFGFIHCGQAGDFIHLPSYIAAGAVLSMVFIVARGNLTYNWLVHALMNLISFVVIVATM